MSESNVPKQGYQIPDEYIKCTRKTSPRELTYDLADKVFGHEVLCRSSMNGSVSNFLKKHCPGIKAKPALDKEKLLAIQGKKIKIILMLTRECPHFLLSFSIKKKSSRYFK